MKVIYYIIMLIIVYPCIGYGQSNDDVYFRKGVLDGGAFDHNVPQIFDLENQPYYTLINNPAYVQLRRDVASRRDTTGVDDFFGLTANYTKKSVDGEYLAFEGDQSISTRFAAIGESEFKGVGSVFGSASYGFKRFKNRALDYTTQYMDYYPYIVVDTVGFGDSSSDSYHIDGGFSFNIGKTYLGVGGDYEGEVARRLSDPRHSSYLSRLRLDLGAAIEHWDHLFALRVSPQFSWQSISVSDYSLKGAKYFQLYGFGLWNRKESSGGYSYNRFMTTNGVEADLVLHSRSKRDDALQYTVSLLGSYTVMNTLESNSKNLFSTHTYYIKPEVSLSKRFNSWDLYLLAASHISSRKGTEHLYEKQLVDGGNNLYDNVKVASSSLYSLSSVTALTQVKGIYDISKQSQLHLLAGADIDRYSEDYTIPYRYIGTTSSRVFAGGGYSRKCGKYAFEFYLRVTKQSNIDSSLDAVLVDDMLSQEFVYIPHFIRGMSGWDINGEVAYSCAFKNMKRVGLRLVGGYSRNASQEPLVDYTQYRFVSRQDILNVNMMLFYQF